MDGRHIPSIVADMIQGTAADPNMKGTVIGFMAVIGNVCGSAEPAARATHLLG
jgi:hypothetical protein